MTKYIATPEGIIIGFIITLFLIWLNLKVRGLLDK